jgi:hypothetical protein
LGFLAITFFVIIFIYLFLVGGFIFAKPRVLFFFPLFFRAKVLWKNARKTRIPNPKRIAKVEIACTVTRAEYESLVPFPLLFGFVLFLDLDFYFIFALYEFADLCAPAARLLFSFACEIWLTSLN